MKELVNAYYCKTVSQTIKLTNAAQKLPHLIYFALTTNYFNVFMSTAVLLGLSR